MAIKTGKFLEKIAKKAGIDTASEVFKPLIDFQDDIPDEVASAIDKSLLTIEAAKSNSDVNKALRQSILGVADTKMDDIAKDLKLTLGEDFLNEKNTYEKINLLSKAIYDAGQKKAAADNQAGVHETLKKEKEVFAAKESEFQKQYAELQKQLKEAKETQEAEIKKYNESLELNSIGYDLHKRLLGKNYDLPTKMDDDLKVQTALVTINKELGKRGFAIKRGEAKELGLFDKDGNPAYSEDHNLLKMDSFIDGVLTQNNLLKINNVEQSGSGQNQQNGTIQNQNGTKGNAAIISEIDAQLAEFSKM